FLDERRNESYATAFPPWRVDRYANDSDRKPAHVGYPPDLPAGCSVLGLASRHVPVVAADGTVYRPISSAAGDCGPSPAPETVIVEDSDTPPANTTFAVTNKDTTGSAKFVIWTAQENASLDCSTTVPCSLVVIPIMGISCDLGEREQSDSDRTACRAN